MTSRRCRDAQESVRDRVELRAMRALRCGQRGPPGAGRRWLRVGRPQFQLEARRLAAHDGDCAVWESRAAHKDVADARRVEDVRAGQNAEGSQRAVPLQANGAHAVFGASCLDHGLQLLVPELKAAMGGVQEPDKGG